jgi:hypothetical protein
MVDDVRDRYDPLASVPDWFWDRITAAQSDPELFVKLTDGELIDFANEMLDLKTYFSHDPFHPPEEVSVTEKTLDEAGAWVISQGKAFFRSVWQEPRRFWGIMADHEYLRGHNFEFAADRAWEDRHGTDIPTI